MKQAKTLTNKELRRVLDHVATRPHAARNRAIIMCTHLAGMRVGECAALRLADVLDSDGQVRTEIRLEAEQTKGSAGRVVFVGEKLRRELAAYLKQLPKAKRDVPLFRSQKRGGFSPNTLCQTLNRVYVGAGLEGATSHSGRRTFITTLASKGVGVRVLASLAGHRSIATTQRYIDVNDDMMRAAVELVA
ncbi:site-specific integrase [Falsiroseomonas sp.]|uniref:tyrosine-type recombinase/integrase n=1 Tax=Falsiroseomonas sp. TaxID=2870721 RepID=UPI002717FB3A|nr:site-specific integrase [Falsiroseomonas sp.]MDO9502767.1 site-specific integrase [Falsiroseomonas sp.]